VRFPPDLEATATSIALATGHLTDRAGLLLAIARRLDALLTDLEAQQLDSWLTKFRDRLGLLGQRVVVDAGTCLDGVLEGVDFAHVRLDGGRSLPLAIVRGIRPAR
jgi:biotin-(acetyl-CoA carboxylase) ligase